jgi:ribosomal protein L34E
VVHYAWRAKNGELFSTRTFGQSRQVQTQHPNQSLEVHEQELFFPAIKFGCLEIGVRQNSSQMLRASYRSLSVKNDRLVARPFGICECTKSVSGFIFKAI